MNVNQPPQRLSSINSRTSEIHPAVISESASMDPDNNTKETANKEQLLTCRICLEDDIRQNLISPCLCSGTCKWVHSACLDQWRASSYQEFRSSFSQCPTCKFSYKVRAGPKRTNYGRRRAKCAAFVARDCLALALLVGIAIICIGVVLKHVDDSLAYCIPECQVSTAGLENPEGLIGPTCVRCAPFQHTLFDIETSLPVVYATFGASVFFAVVGFFGFIANAFMGPRLGWRLLEPMVPTFGDGKSHEAIVITAIAFFSFIGCLIHLAQKHAQYVGLYVATEDFQVIDLEDTRCQQLQVVEEQEVNNAVRHILMQ